METFFPVVQRQPGELTVALAGNPNVGKSTVFNALTGMNQHTGNWPGKTVATAQGRCRRGKDRFLLVDLPGTYSLLAHSAEEEAARDFVCFGGADAVIVVCDATRLERSLNLALQVIEVTDRVVVCVNLLDEARKKRLSINLNALQQELGVPVVGVSARARRGLDALLEQTARVARRETAVPAVRQPYPQPIEKALAAIQASLPPIPPGGPSVRWISVRLLCGGSEDTRRISDFCGCPPDFGPAASAAASDARAALARDGAGRQKLLDQIAACPVLWAESAAAAAVSSPGRGDALDRRLDRLFISRRTGIPVMLLLLFGVLWLTIAGANIPSQWLSARLFAVQDWLSAQFMACGAPEWLHGALVLGVYQVLAWVVSVMLPPMAIFFPAVHPARRLRLPAPRGLQPGLLLSKGLCLRQAGADHVYVLWLQRRRRDGLPHHRFPPRTADRHTDQLSRPLQRPFPRHTDHFVALFCRRSRRSRRGAAVCPAPDRRHRSGRRHDLSVLARTVQNRTARHTVRVHARTAALPPRPRSAK